VFPRDFEGGARRWSHALADPLERHRADGEAIAVLALFSFIGYWNNFLWPLIVGNTREMATVRSSSTF
jgi:hypothetical protein